MLNLVDSRSFLDAKALKPDKENTTAIFMLGFDKNLPHRLFNINPNVLWVALAFLLHLMNMWEKCLDENRLSLTINSGGEKNVLHHTIVLSILQEQLLQVIYPLLGTIT